MRAVPVWSGSCQATTAPPSIPAPDLGAVGRAGWPHRRFRVAVDRAEPRPAVAAEPGDPDVGHHVPGPKLHRGGEAVLVEVVGDHPVGDERLTRRGARERGIDPDPLADVGVDQQRGAEARSPRGRSAPSRGRTGPGCGRSPPGSPRRRAARRRAPPRSAAGGPRRAGPSRPGPGRSRRRPRNGRRRRAAPLPRPSRRRAPPLPSGAIATPPKSRISAEGPSTVTGGVISAVRARVAGAARRRRRDRRRLGGADAQPAQPWPLGRVLALGAVLLAGPIRRWTFLMHLARALPFSFLHLASAFCLVRRVFGLGGCLQRTGAFVPSVGGCSPSGAGGSEWWRTPRSRPSPRSSSLCRRRSRCRPRSIRRIWSRRTAPGST